MEHVIYNFGALGDTIMATPGLRHLRKLLPLSDRVVLRVGVEPQNRIFEGLPSVNAVVAGGEPPYGLGGRWQTEQGGTRLIRLDIMDAYQRAVTTGEPYAVGLCRQLTGEKPDDLHYEVGLLPRHWEVGKSIFEGEIKNGTRPVAVCSPYSVTCSSRHGGAANKMLPKELWLDLAARLSKDFDLAFISAADETPFLGLPAGTPWFAGAKLAVVATWLKMADIVISVENGILCLAQAMDANIVGIVGGVPVRYHWTGTHGRAKVISFFGRGGPSAVSVELVEDTTRRLIEEMGGRR